jgi:hypothetical protein
MPEYFVAFQKDQGTMQYLGHTTATDPKDAVSRVSANHRVAGHYLAIDMADVEEYDVSFDAPQVTPTPPTPAG